MHIRRRRMAMHRKLHILKTLITKSKSVKRRRSIIKLQDAYLHIYKLMRLRGVAAAKYNQYLINRHIHQEVRVEKVENMRGGSCLWVRISCAKSADDENQLMVSILETFEEWNLVVVEAKLTSKHSSFAMEAIVKADDEDDVDASILNRAIVNVIHQVVTKVQ